MLLLRLSRDGVSGGGDERTRLVLEMYSLEAFAVLAYGRRYGNAGFWFCEKEALAGRAVGLLSVYLERDILEKIDTRVFILAIWHMVSSVSTSVAIEGGGQL